MSEEEKNYSVEGKVDAILMQFVFFYNIRKSTPKVKWAYRQAPYTVHAGNFWDFYTAKPYNTTQHPSCSLSSDEKESCWSKTEWFRMDGHSGRVWGWINILCLMAAHQSTEQPAFPRFSAESYYQHVHVQQHQISAGSFSHESKKTFWSQKSCDLWVFLMCS